MTTNTYTLTVSSLDAVNKSLVITPDTLDVKAGDVVDLLIPNDVWPEGVTGTATAVFTFDKTSQDQDPFNTSETSTTVSNISAGQKSTVGTVQNNALIEPDAYSIAVNIGELCIRKILRSRLMSPETSCAREGNVFDAVYFVFFSVRIPNLGSIRKFESNGVSIISLVG